MAVNAQAPHEDTAFKDLYGLTLDGVEFSQPVSTTLLTGDIAPGVDVLMGSNLDEGTEFIFLTSPVTCNMVSMQCLTCPTVPVHQRLRVKLFLLLMLKRLSTISPRGPKRRSQAIGAIGRHKLLHKSRPVL
eukprot:INCI6207.3.p1 GENE.INCI6207.3~~INCI6207.3.p1  ORF type:complete len:131 (+),score=9.28 INCI6207.3:631-1023(+)